MAIAIAVLIFFRLELTVSISYENMLNSEQHETLTTFGKLSTDKSL